jgi:hypothetical protein
LLGSDSPAWVTALASHGLMSYLLPPRVL